MPSLPSGLARLLTSGPDPLARSMITEVITFVCGAMFIGLAAWLGYRAGKDFAQREADYTIAQLRRAVLISRKEVDDLQGRINRLMRQVNR